MKFSKKRYKEIVEKGCGSYKHENDWGYDWDCSHGYEWTCDACPCCIEHNKPTKTE